MEGATRCGILKIKFYYCGSSTPEWNGTTHVWKQTCKEKWFTFDELAKGVSCRIENFDGPTTTINKNSSFNRDGGCTASPNFNPILEAGKVFGTYSRAPNYYGDRLEKCRGNDCYIYTGQSYYGGKQAYYRFFREQQLSPVNKIIHSMACINGSGFTGNRCLDNSKDNKITDAMKIFYS